MVETARKMPVKIEQRKLPSFNLATLRIGLDNINTGYELGDVLHFIKEWSELGVKVEVETWTGRYSPPIISRTFLSEDFAGRQNFFPDENSIIAITDRIEPYRKTAGGRRTVTYPNNFHVVFSKDIENYPRRETIHLFIRGAKERVRSKIRKSLGEIPENWTFQNPRITHSPKETIEL